MGQLTLYLDDETEAKMKEAAAEAGVSQSRWVVGLIRQRMATQWPKAIVRLAGAWADFPSAEEVRVGQSEDVPRESLEGRYIA